MLLWVLFAVLAATVVAVLVRPLTRPGAAPLAPAEADVAVYRDQLAEIDADLERGLIGEAEAEAARVEVARRLLRRADAVPASPGPVEDTGRAQPRSFKVSHAAVALIPILSIALYQIYGSPELPGLPLAARGGAPVEKASVAELIAKVEKRLREQPADGQGWDVIAPVYARLERHAEAADAYRRAMALLGETPDRLSGYVEAAILANNGIVSEEARRACLRLLEIDKGRVDARIWLALAKEQDGDIAGAVADYEVLLDGADKTAPWREALEVRIAQLTGREAPKRAAPGEASGAVPQGLDPDAIAAMSPGERGQLIEQMVAGLAERLKANGKDLEGWRRLLRAYRVLGRQEEARSALKSARQAFAGDAKALSEIDELARSLGIGS